MLNQLIFILLGSLVLYYIYFTNIQMFQNYESKRIKQLKQYFYDNVSEDLVGLNKFLAEYKSMYPPNVDVNNQPLTQYNSLNQKYSLLHAMSMLDHVNKYTQRAMNLYDVCYKNGNPCNEHCLQLNSDFCKIHKYTNSLEN
jgi:hypothetical protein